jgi:cysteine-rich repeat protein
VKSVIVAIAIFVAACANKPAAHECASGIVCPDPLQCAAVQPVCISNSCGNGVVDPGETCDDGNILNGDGCAADCKSKESCGDGVLNTDAGEVCDDGNTVDGDGCSADCKSLEACGNGIVDTAKGEVCDDGNTHAGKCGDGHGCETTADCTDGTLCAPDGCSSDCKSNETCGNGIKDLGEVCDDGGAAGGCEDDCQHGVGCGNGVLDPGEQCDDGNLTDTDDCTSGCKINVCGDGVIDTSGITHHETCDRGANGIAVETADCNIDCSTPTCGDGKVNSHFKPDGTHGEQCDLGSTGATNNNADTAACTAACQVNVCGDGKQASTEACDHGAMNGTTGNSCDIQCKVVGCGNGILEVGEQCDPRAPVFTSPNDPTQTATCDDDCTAAFCGDSKTNSAALEVCDQGTSNGTDCPWAMNATTCIRCASDCRTVNNTKAAPFCGDGTIDVGHEVCDQGADNGTPCPYGTSCQRCDATCATLTTQAGPSCGDNLISAVNNEQCDGTMIPKTCLQLGYASGTPLCFAPGTANQCHYDVTPCVPTCGNGVVETGEQCDTTIASATCNANCTKPVCGDLITNTLFKPDGTNPENCDNGVNNDDTPTCPTYNTSCAARCSSNCRLFTPHEKTCGDSTIDSPNETCDDGNTTNGVTECGYPSTLPCEACHACQDVVFAPQKCGDGTVQAGHEDCEPPNTVSCGPSCHTPTCADTFKDGLETDVDCGGATCSATFATKCDDGLHCLVAADCQSGVCTGTSCSVPTCTDTVQNGTETGVDCGNASCKACAGTACTLGTECHSTVCDGTGHCT